MKLSVVIPNWNGLEFLKTCLNSLQKQTLDDFEIIVIDNGSLDGSLDLIKIKYPKVKLISLDKNYGFAYAVNRGIEKAESEYIVLLNNDTEVDKNCLKYLYETAKEKSDVGFVAAKMLNFYKRDRIDSCGDYIDNVGHANNIGLGEKDGLEYEKAGYVFLVTGGGGLFKKQVFEKVGLFDEKYFAYFEDVDLCLRAQLLGFKGWFVPKAKIYHVHKATSDRIKSFREYLQFRNMTLTIIKDFPNALIAKNWLLIILVNLNTVRFLATKGFLWEAIKAEFYILCNLPKLLKQRNKIQKSKKVTDEYMIENFKKKETTFFGLFR